MNESAARKVGVELDGLRAAANDWIVDGKSKALGRWLERELDPDGVPRRLDVADWYECLELLAGAYAERPDSWPERFDARAEGWFRELLRFSRPDGSTAFAPPDASKGGRKAGFFRGWAERLSDPGLSTVVDWWFPRPAHGRHAPPPLPADARPDRPLAVLRANWMRDGDFVTVDHRAVGGTTLFELYGLGIRWLGPAWGSGTITEPAKRARPTLWLSQSSADVAEWTFRVGPARVTRTAVLLRGRRLALVAEQWDGPGDPGELRLDLPEGIEAGPIPESDSRGLALTSLRKRGAARVFPIGLPATAYPTERGSFSVDGRVLSLRQAATPGRRRAWRVLLVSWEPRRNRQPVRWRTLTVSESSRACPADVAFGARVTWGRNETLLIYRSLAPPAVRAVLGHQTRARFLVGLFSREGEVEPLVKVDE